MPSLNFRRYYNAFREIISIVHSSPQIEEVMNIVVWKVAEVFNAKGALFRLLDVETEKLEMSVAFGIGKNYLEKTPRMVPNLIIDLCTQNKLFIINDIWNDSRVLYPKEAEAEGVQCMVDIPLIIGTEAYGIIRIYFPEVREFSEDEQNFMVAIAEQCSCALGKARLIESHELKYHQLAMHADKLSSLGRMAAGIAHEINNPLAGILLYSSNMAKKAEEDSFFKEGLDIIIHETIRCRKIIQGLLDFSREREPQKDPCFIEDIIDKSMAILENEFLLSRIEVRKIVPDDLPLLMVDGNQLEQVFVNLLINSVEVLPEGGLIEIISTVKNEDRVVEVEIRDNGTGVSQEEINKIFEPFYSTKSHGTGLGLAVSYGIIQKHQGRIWVEKNEYGGASFKIELPFMESKTLPGVGG